MKWNIMENGRQSQLQHNLHSTKDYAKFILLNLVLGI